MRMSEEYIVFSLQIFIQGVALWTSFLRKHCELWSREFWKIDSM